MMHLDRLAVLALATVFVAGLGCERSPDDVERWRDAKGGMEKMQEWATSSSEPMPVRVRAVQVIIEENAPTILEPTFKKISDKNARQKLVSGGVETIQKMWDKQDMPTMDETTKSGKVKIKKSKSVQAKDAAYYLQPFAKGKTKAKLESILAEWLSEDWKLRNKLGD
ncbi:MAG: hypothetical protein ABEN55_20745, partial [Bradymonadaceae bacterium]